MTNEWKYPAITTERLVLRAPELGDVEKLKEFEDRNWEHLGLWETLSKEPVATRLKNQVKEIEEGRAIRYLMFFKGKADGPYIGMCNYTQIFRGFFQACYLGYKVDKVCEGKGLMSEALEGSLEYIFGPANIHRVMANYIPTNERSAKVLKNLGFDIEGLAKAYLLINNRWEDHVLTAKTNPNWKHQR